MNDKRISSILLIFMMVFSTFLSNNFISYAEENKEYININGSIFEFNKIVYIDAAKGSDENSGQKSLPVQSFDKAIQLTSDGDAIVFYDGEYTFNNIYELFSNKRSYIGIDQGALLIFNKYVMPNQNISDVYFYRLTFMPGTMINGPAFIKFEHLAGTQNIAFDMYNCVFDDPNNNFIPYTSNGMTFLAYFCGDISSSNVNKYNINFYNCTSKKYRIFDTLNDGTINVNFNNLALENVKIYGVTGVTAKVSNCLTSAVIDDSYNVLSDGWQNTGSGLNPDGSQAHIGVYGGPFAWGDYKEEVEDTLEVVLEPTEQLLLSVDDEILENEEVNWESSDPTVASVDANGKLTAHAVGKTVITVTNDTGSYKEEINVLVVESADDYRLAVDLKVGEKCRLTFDGNTKTKKVTWTSVDTRIATVTSKGKVKAVNKGLVMITATDDKNKEKQVYVRIR